MILKSARIVLYRPNYPIMKISLDNWTIEDLINKKDRINPKPQYQRTPVWSNTKKVFLIDSILRTYDLPKFYIKETIEDLSYDFEVTDGQQRMRAIWDFVEGEFQLASKEISNTDYRGLFYDELPNEIKDQFNNFKLSLTIIKKATQEEIRTLFARLQMGMTLIPVELRHALASNLGTSVFMITENHKFFDSSCKIVNTRFKHQDYLDHVIALIYYQGKRDIKAPTLYQLYIDLSTSQGSELTFILKRVNKILDWMHEINVFYKGAFRNKWGFVDTFWLLYTNYDKISTINYDQYAKNLNNFENRRKKYNPNPELLIEDKESIEYDKDLFDYIEAFNRQGSLKKNISIRHRVFNSKFNNTQNFNLKHG